MVPQNEEGARHGLRPPTSTDNLVRQPSQLGGPQEKEAGQEMGRDLPDLSFMPEKEFMLPGKVPPTEGYPGACRSFPIPATLQRPGFLLPHRGIWRSSQPVDGPPAGISCLASRLRADLSTLFCRPVTGNSGVRMTWSGAPSAPAMVLARS